MEIVHLYISPEHNFFGHHGKPPGEHPAVAVGSIDCVEGKGIVGDRFYGFKDGYVGQVTFFSLEVYERLCGQFDVHDKDPSVFRRNVVVRGVDLNSLVGVEFAAGGARFLGTEEARPCYWMNRAFCEGAEEALRGNGGLRAKVIRSGELHCRVPAPPRAAG